jgi:hypothetical protein
MTELLDIVQEADAAGKAAVGEWKDVGTVGYAWVCIWPARGPLVSFLKKRGGGYTQRGYGYMMEVNGYGQAMGPKYDYAGAFAKVLTKHGYNAMPMCRAD